MPTIFACAVVRDDPPRVFAAEDIDTLHWLVALQLVAATPGAQLPVSAREGLRDALREERWGDAVGLWIEHTGIAVDVYPSVELALAADIALAKLEIQFQPLFAS
jgi:hypothetical protein